jgi:CxxC-x17-CxxC domain-containing protein
MGDHVIEASEIQFEDKYIKCSDCGETFIFSAGEQKFFADKNLRYARKRCRECNAKKSERIKRAKIRGTVPQSNVTITDVVCDECGRDTTVPFIPTQGKPVYCPSCFGKKRKKQG